MKRYGVTNKTHSEDGLPTISELERRHQDWSSGQPMKITCGHCDAFDVEGPTTEARAQFKHHLAIAHPNISQRRRTRRSSNEARDEAMATVAARRGLAGVISGDGAT